MQQLANLYAVGSKVVHPNHGAGVVVGVQAKSIGETCHRYYIIETHTMRLMVPVEHAVELGLRRVGSLADLRDMLTNCCEPPRQDDVSQDHRVRKAKLDGELKSGSFERAVYAIRVLFFLNSVRPLGMVDRRLYDRGMNLIASEYALAADITVDEAKEEIESLLGAMLVEQEVTEA